MYATLRHIVPLGSFLGTLEKLRRVTISFVISVSVRMEQLGFHWTYFRGTSYLSIFENLQKVSSFITV